MPTKSHRQKYANKSIRDSSLQLPCKDNSVSTFHVFSNTWQTVVMSHNKTTSHTSKKFEIKHYMQIF